MLLTDCPPVKMGMYMEEEVLRWIDSELDDDAQNEILILGDAEVNEYVKDHEQLLQKKKQKGVSIRRTKRASSQNEENRKD